MKTVTIGYDAAAGAITVDPDPVKVQVLTDKKVRWQSKQDELKDWRVVFGAYAPVYKTKEPKVASPADDTLDLKKNRAEDLGHWKYVVVALTKDGLLTHKDPELIVDP